MKRVEIGHTYEEPNAQQIREARTLVQGFADRWAKLVPDELYDLMHSDTQNLIPPMSEPGDSNAVVAHFAEVQRNLPDLALRVIRWAATGDSVLIEFEGSASVAGQLLKWTGVDRFSIRDGKMYEAPSYWDTRGLAERMAAAVDAVRGSAQS